MLKNVKAAICLALALVGWTFLSPVAALAAAAPTPVVTGNNLGLVALSLVAPIVGYLLNHYAKWASEQAKGIVQAVLAAGAGVLYQLLGSGDAGFNKQTAVAVLTAMGLALAAHIGYKAGGLNTFFGAGTNAGPTTTPSTQRRLVG